MYYNLVILPIGSRSITNQWPEKNFDLWTFGFDGSGIRDKYSDKHFEIKNFKYHAIKEIIETHDISKYEYIWLPDDDLVISASDINKMFNIAIYNDLMLGQPSVHPDSYLTAHFYLRTNPKYTLRCSNFIEVMCPFFHKNFLMECIDLFDTNYSSYGIDVKWSFRADPTKSAVIDAVSVKHIRQVLSGDLYKKLNALNTKADKELEVIFRELGLKTVREYLYIEGGMQF